MASAPTKYRLSRKMTDLLYIFAINHLQKIEVRAIRSFFPEHTRSLDGGSAKIAPETPSFPEHTRLPDGAAPRKQGRRRKSFGDDQERVISSGKQALPEQQVKVH